MRAAELTALVVSEPTSRKDVLMLSRTALESGLGRNRVGLDLGDYRRRKRLTERRVHPREHHDRE